MNTVAGCFSHVEPEIRGVNWACGDVLELTVRTLSTQHVTDVQSHAKQLLYIKVTHTCTHCLICCDYSLLSEACSWEISASSVARRSYCIITLLGWNLEKPYVSHPDGQHHMGVALQDLHCIAVCDVMEADPVGCEDLVAHFDAVLLCETAWVQPEETKQTTLHTQTHHHTWQMQHGSL